MRRAADGELTRTLPFPPDPDEVERVVGKLVYGMGFDATLLLQLDPEHLLRNRRRMMGLLSRHFRIPPSYWEDRQTAEMDRWLGDMVELAAEERPTIDIE